MGLVKTAEDFGVQGEAPSHPELLDWLAVEFRESRLGSQAPASADGHEPDLSAVVARDADPARTRPAKPPAGARAALPAASTTIRDQALALSGLLVEQVGGPPVKPYQPAGIWEEFSFGQIRYQQDRGPSLYRRSLYTFWRRTVGPTNLFDASMRQVCEVKPTRTNTPLHALVTLNDVTFAEASRVLAWRMAARGRQDGRRTPRLGVHAGDGAPAERPRAGGAGTRLARLLAEYRADPAAARKLVQRGRVAGRPDGGRGRAGGERGGGEPGAEPGRGADAGVTRCVTRRGGRSRRRSPAGCRGW